LREGDNEPQAPPPPTVHKRDRRQFFNKKVAKTSYKLMTKKDFIVIAGVIRTIFGALDANEDTHEGDMPLTSEQKQIIVGAFTGELMKENPRFDADRFTKTCYGEK
jgi:hypothetical protein